MLTRYEQPCYLHDIQSTATPQVPTRTLSTYRVVSFHNVVLVHFPDLSALELIRQIAQEEIKGLVTRRDGGLENPE